MPQRVRSVAVGYYIGITLLVIGLGIAFALVTRIADPAAGRGVEVGPPLAVQCEPGDGTPSCFEFSVRNASGAPTSVECLVVPAERTFATFSDGISSTVLTLRPAEQQLLRTSVDTDGGDAVAAPTLDCTTLSPGG
jgi:hypothetical protein